MMACGKRVEVPAVISSHCVAGWMLSTLSWLILLMKKVWPTEGVEPAPNRWSTPTRVVPSFPQLLLTMPGVPLGMEPAKVLHTHVHDAHG